MARGKMCSHKNKKMYWKKSKNLSYTDRNGIAIAQGTIEQSPSRKATALIFQAPFKKIDLQTYFYNQFLATPGPLLQWIMLNVLLEVRLLDMSTSIGTTY